MTFKTVLLAAAITCAVVAPAAAMAQDFGHGGYGYSDERGYDFHRRAAARFEREREYEAYRAAEFRRAHWRDRYETRAGWGYDGDRFERPRVDYGDERRGF